MTGASTRGGSRSGEQVLPTFSPTLHRWFCRYLRRYFRKHFTAVRVRTAPNVSGVPAESRPTVVYANHPSWWDPILFMLLHEHRYPDHGIYGPMDAKALEKYGFMRRLGVFGIDLESRRGAVTFLRTSRAVLARPDAVLWITAQGRFTDPRARPVELQPGLAHLARSVPGLVIQPLAVEYPFWNERNPEALACFGPVIDTSGEPTRTTQEWNEVLARRLEDTQDTLARFAAAREPDAFRVLVDGRRGVGGAYDAWRRLRSWGRGQPFRAAHEEG